MNSEQFKLIQKFEKRFFWYKARREIILELLRKFNLLNVNKAVLEIGSANGANLEYFGRYYKVIKGSEINRDALYFSKQTLPLTEVEYGYLPDKLGFENEKFDIIFLFDVLEHVEDDNTSLIEIYHKLNENGHLIITVPAYQFLFGEHDKISHHFRRYNKTNLTSLLIKNGFNVRYCSYFNFWLFPIVLVSRLIEKFTNKTIGLGYDKFQDSIINKIFTAIMSSEKHLLKRKIKLPFGSSIIGICTKILT